MGHLYQRGKVWWGDYTHPALDLETDTRDWDAEILAEYADAAFYATFRAIQKKRGLL